jgi:hypothetical protein
VPYKPRFGFVNIEYLRWLAPPSLDPEIFRPFLESCLEFRGLPAAQGVYIPVTYLNDGIFEALRLRFDARQVVEKRDKSLDEYTHNNWYLLAPTESSDLYPVRRETQRMHFRSAEMSLAQFLKEYFPKNTYLDSQIPHKPEWLVMPNRVEQRLGSCQGSVSLDSSRHRFRFGRGRGLPKPKGEEEEIRHDRTGNEETGETTSEDNWHPRTTEWVSQQPLKRQKTLKESL